MTAAVPGLPVAPASRRGYTFHVSPLPPLVLDLRTARSAAHAAHDEARQILADLLTRHGWNVRSAAHEAGVHRVTLHKMIRRVGLTRPHKDN